MKLNDYMNDKINMKILGVKMFSREFAITFLWVTILFFLLPIILVLFVLYFTENKIGKFINLRFKSGSLHHKVSSLKNLNVSFVIPHYNKKFLLDKCITSLFETNILKNSDNEVIVVDDGSTDDSVEFLKYRFPFVKVLENSRNRGFAYSCNRGIKEAKNELIVLLNNDVIVTNGFLNSLIRHFNDKKVFAVSPKMYGWDKKKFIRGMEIGDFKQGYFRFWNEKDTSHGEKIYNTSPSFYTMGAAMVCRRNYFLKLGGFDSLYQPHWWEDIDICYKAQKRGLKILYEPEALVYHKEGASIGKYKGSLAKRNEFIFILKNFTDKEIIFDFFRYLPIVIYNGGWDFLFGFLESLKSIPEILFKRFRERKHIKLSDRKVLRKTSSYYKNFKKRKFENQIPEKRTLLLLSPFFPYPTKHGMQVKVWNTIKSLSAKFDIIFLSFYREGIHTEYIHKLKPYCKKIFTVRYEPGKAGFFSKIIYPTSIMKWYYNIDFKNCLLEILNNYPIDIVLIESSFLIQYVKYIENFPTVLVEHDPSILSFKNSFIKISENRLKQISEWGKTRVFLNNMYRKFDEISVFTNQDKNLLLKLNHRLNVTVIPISLDKDYYVTDKYCKKDIDLLFIGYFLHYPNLEGLKFFLKEVYPILISKLGKINFKIIGSGISKDKLISILGINKDPHIEILGEVSDIRQYLNRAKVFVAPIEIGGGMKVKILEAMACGIPVVATIKAAEGIEVKTGKNILIGNNSLSMAKQIIRLLEDKKLAKMISENGGKLIKSNYNFDKISYRQYTYLNRLIKN